MSYAEQFEVVVIPLRASVYIPSVVGGITEKMKVRKNSFFDMESLVGIIMSVCAKF